MKLANGDYRPERLYYVWNGLYKGHGVAKYRTLTIEEKVKWEWLSEYIRKEIESCYPETETQ